jgi:hypothetical protein
MKIDIFTAGAMAFAAFAVYAYAKNSKAAPATGVVATSAAQALQVQDATGQNLGYLQNWATATYTG